jgi:hypothetical protein
VFGRFSDARVGRPCVSSGAGNSKMEGDGIMRARGPGLDGLKRCQRDA